MGDPHKQTDGQRDEQANIPLCFFKFDQGPLCVPSWQSLTSEAGQLSQLHVLRDVCIDWPVWWSPDQVQGPLLCLVGQLMGEKLWVELVPREEEVCECSSLYCRNGKKKLNAFYKGLKTNLDLLIPDIIRQQLIFIVVIVK